jgi:hypothetical protein
MKRINTSGSARLAALLAGATLFGLASQSALAVGTPVNTAITNTATLSYSVSGTSQTPIPVTSASFLVDAKINLVVAGGVTTNVVPGALAQATAFTVTNFSNTASLDFSLAATSVIAGDNFDPAGCNVYVESGATAGYQSAEDTATYIDELTGDGVTTATVYAVCNIPGTATNTQTGLVGLTATAQGDFTGANNTYAPTAGALSGTVIAATAGANTANVDIVLADAAGVDEGSASNGKHSARNTYSVVITLPTITKTATLVCDPYNTLANAKSIPGSIVKWTVVVNNPSATTPVTLTSVTDTLANMTHDAHLSVPTGAADCVADGTTFENAAGKGFKVVPSASRNLGGSAGGAGAVVSYFTSANDADGVENNGGAITATFATILPVDAGTGHATAGLLNAGESVTLIFNATID